MKKLRNKGPMSTARFMHLWLTDPQYGYYTSKSDIFNEKGDFTTSPEISQMFGEMIGVWYTTALQKYTNLKHWNFVELGPGKGTLLWDILRTFSQLNILSNMTFNLVEISDNLKEIQRDNIIDTLRKRKIYISQDLKTKDLYDENLNLKFEWK